jgi:hypothetical protein
MTNFCETSDIMALETHRLYKFYFTFISNTNMVAVRNSECDISVT